MLCKSIDRLYMRATLALNGLSPKMTNFVIKQKKTWTQTRYVCLKFLIQNLLVYVPVSSNFTLVRSFASPEAATGRVLSKRCSQKFGKFYRKTPVLESLFDKVAALKTRNVIKKRLQHRCFPVKFAKFFRKSILKKICEQDLAVASFSKTTVLRKDYSDRFYFEMKIKIETK